MMTKVISAIAKALDKHNVTDCHVCIGLSGGLDSVVLLTAMHELAASRKIRLSAVHVNHGLSSFAQDWSSFCSNLCAQLGIALTIEPVIVDRNAGLGLEAAARAVRYNVFSQIRSDFLALAHHADDQVETFLIQLLRGSGPNGLSAMPLARELDDEGPCLLRPLLSLPRAELEIFARQRSLDWVEDDSNSNLSLDRNFLRRAVLPLLEQRFPAYRATLLRVTRNLADSAQLADALGGQDLRALRADDAVGNGLCIPVLKCWPQSRAVNALRCLLRTEGNPLPHRAAIQEALRQMLDARQEANVRIDFGKVSLRRYRERVYLVRNLEVPAAWSVSWTGQASVMLPPGLGELQFGHTHGAGLSARAIQNGEVSVCFRRGGERMAVAAGRPHRNLRKLFQDAGVAPWLRERTPILMCGTKLVCIPGLGLAPEFHASPDEASIKVAWLQP